MQGKVNEAKQSAGIKTGKPAKPKKAKKNNGKR
jgi:hypothetical protein